MDFLYLALALLICISLHESAHAWVADKLGDPTARLLGRVSLNPLRHLDPLGTLMMVLVHFGWGKPVPFDERNLKNPRRDAALISLAGPLANLATAALVAVFLRYYRPLEGGLVWNLSTTVFTLSLVLFLFNILPIGPLDGSKLFELLIPTRHVAAYERYLHHGPVILLILIFGDRLIEPVTGFSLFGAYLGFGFEFLRGALLLGA